MKEENVRHIKWNELDKRKYYVIGPTMSIFVRLFIYPPVLIKTRLQVQKQHNQYKGTLDAFRKIYKFEGVRGFYKGFGTNLFTVVSGQMYVTTLEYVRLNVPFKDEATKSLCAGAMASFAGQTITIPVDIISQYQMMHGQKVVQQHVMNKHRQFKSGWTVIREIYSANGVRGFYKGYLVSLMTYMPSSAIWWGSYYTFTQLYDSVTPDAMPHLPIQGLSGMSAGCVASVLTNPIDTIRTRIQTTGQKISVRTVVKRLYEEEGRGALLKGLTARLASSVPSSLILATGYETVKFLCLKDEFR